MICIFKWLAELDLENLHLFLEFTAFVVVKRFTVYPRCFSVEKILSELQDHLGLTVLVEKNVAGIL